MIKSIKKKLKNGDQKPESRFEDIPESIKECLHPDHEPPKYIYIPQGKMYIHVCPGCHKEVRIKSQSYSFKAYKNVPELLLKYHD